MAMRRCVRLRLFATGNYFGSTIPARSYRYNKKGGMKPGRRIPVDWRKVDHNPAKIPWAWIPDKWKEENTVDYEREKELAKYIPGYEPKIRETEDPNYHSEASYKFSSTTKLLEGLSQVLHLTKSVLFAELPPRIKEIEVRESIKNQNERVIQAFRHALLFDIDPANLDKENKVKREKLDNFKIYPSIDRYCPNIVESMLRLCQSHQSVLQTADERLITRNIESSAFFRRTSDLKYDSGSDLDKTWLVSINAKSDRQVMSQDPLPFFASPDVVRKTASMELPDIFPVFPIVGLKKTQIYEKVTSTGLAKGFSHKHLHSIFIHNLLGFTPDELYAQMTCQLFTHLYSRAIDDYGDKPIELPTPICGQAVASDGKNFQFMCMQLNTTKLDSDSGVKNIVWIDGRQESQGARKTYASIPMFKSCSHRTWQSPEYYIGYDPSVFQTFLSLWLNGAS